MLTFVGLGLHDERSVTLRGRDAISGADRVFAEFYTSHLAGASLEELSAFHDAPIELRDRAGVERDPDPVLEAAAGGDAAFLTAGDAMVATTHVDLRLRAHERGIDTGLVHGPSVQTAACGLTGLQSYRFGKATTLPFPDGPGDPVPASVIETVEANRERGLHTLVLLDIDAAAGRMLGADVAARTLAEHDRDRLGVAVARAGSDDPTVAADRCSALGERDFGPSPHLLVVPGELHEMEREALRAFADAPEDALETD